MDWLGVNFAAFLGVSILVIVTPGQDTALTIRNTLLGGRGSGVATAAGVSTGQLTSFSGFRRSGVPFGATTELMQFGRSRARGYEARWPTGKV